MTKQEYYDLLVRSASDGTFPSVRKVIEADDAMPWTTHLCEYRGTNGKKCAIGVIIPDDKYCKEMERCRIGKLVSKWGLELPEGIRADDASQIQLRHDGLALERWDGEEFIYRINNLACFSNINKRMA